MVLACIWSQRIDGGRMCSLKRKKQKNKKKNEKKNVRLSWPTLNTPRIPFGECDLSSPVESSGITRAFRERGSIESTVCLGTATTDPSYSTYIYVRFWKLRLVLCQIQYSTRNKLFFKKPVPRHYLQERHRGMSVKIQFLSPAPLLYHRWVESRLPVPSWWPPARW